MEIWQIAIPVLALALSGDASKLPVAPPLPDNKPCPFPAEAERQGVAGALAFVAQVAPDGRTESVEITAVPSAGLGFEEAVRACVSSWRFQPMPDGETGPRVYQQTVRFRHMPAEEHAIRNLFERLATEWSTGDKARVEDLQARMEEAPNQPVQTAAWFPDRLRAQGVDDACQMRLTPYVSYLRFFSPTLAQVRQDFRAFPRPETAEDRKTRRSSWWWARAWPLLFPR